MGEIRHRRCTVQRSTIHADANYGILFSEVANNVMVDGNTFSGQVQAMITSILGLYPGLTTGFGNFTISDNTFNSQRSRFPCSERSDHGFVLNGNTVTNRMLVERRRIRRTRSGVGERSLVENNTLGTRSERRRWLRGRQCRHLDKYDCANTAS